MFSFLLTVIGVVKENCGGHFFPHLSYTYMGSSYKAFQLSSYSMPPLFP
jgi:hypothetical protein